MVGSTPAALGRDFRSDILSDSETVLVYGVPPVACYVNQTFIRWRDQRGVSCVQFGR